MAQAITGVNIKNEDNSFTYVPIAVKAENIKLTNNKDLESSVAFFEDESESSEIKFSKSPLYQEDVIDNLLSNSSIAPLSGKQGKVLNERINVLSNFDGTPSDLEVADLRVGANGETYPSAGVAVRENFNILRNKDLKAKENINNKIRGRGTGGGYVSAPGDALYPSLEFLEGYYYTADEIDEIVAGVKNNIDTQEWKELTDIRNGADGNYYSTAGEAIRKNINKIYPYFENKIALLTNNKTMLFDKDFNLLGTPSDLVSLSGGAFVTIAGDENVSKVAYAVISSKVTNIYSGAAGLSDGLLKVYINNFKENIQIDPTVFSRSNAEVLFLDNINSSEPILDILPLLKIYSQLAQLEKQKVDNSNNILALNSSQEILEVNQQTTIKTSQWKDSPFIEQIVSIYIPSSVDEIESDAFKECSNLTDIYINNYKDNIIAYDVFPSGVAVHWNTSLNEIDIIHNTLLNKVNSEYVNSQIKQVTDTLDVAVNNIEENLNTKASLGPTRNVLTLKDGKYELNGISVTVKNNAVLVTGTATSATFIHIPIENFIFQAGVNYCLTATNIYSTVSSVPLTLRARLADNSMITIAGVKLSLYEAYENGTQSVTLASTAEYDNCFLGCYVSADTTVSKQFNLQLEKGDVFTRFVPSVQIIDYVDSYSKDETDAVTNQFNLDISELQEQVSKIYSVNSSGDLKLETTTVEGCSAKFISTKIDNVVTVAVNATLPKGKNYVAFSGLPYQFSNSPQVSDIIDGKLDAKAMNIAVFSQSQTLVRARVTGSWVSFTAVDAKFPEDDSITLHITYLTNT